MMIERRLGKDKESPQEKVRSLIQRALFSDPKSSSDAARQLAFYLFQSPIYSLTTSAVEELQEYALLGISSTEKSDQEIGGKALIVLDGLIEKMHFISKRKRRKGKRVEISEEVVQAAERIKTNHDRLQKQGNIPPHIIAYVSELSQAVENAQKNDNPHVVIAPKLPDKQPQDIAESNWRIWRENIRSIYSKEKLDSADPKRVDQLIDLLREEPIPDETAQSSERIFEKKFGDLSFRDIEKLPYPLPDDTMNKITAMLATALADENIFHRDMTRALLLTRKYMRDEKGEKEFRNREFIKKLNQWQEDFIYNLVFKKDDETDEAIKSVLNQINDEEPKVLTAEASLITNLAKLWITHAYEMLEEVHIESPPMRLPRQAREAYDKGELDEYFSSKNSFELSDEIGRAYYIEKIHPALSQRIQELGAMNKFRQSLEVTIGATKEYTYEKYHLDSMKDNFLYRCGSEFIEKLNNHADSLHEIGQEAFHSALDGMHFLPMADRTNTVIFTKGSMGQIAGLSDIHMIRTGGEKDWKIDVAFRFQDTIILIVGNLNQDGKLILRAHLQDEMPGMHALLSTIASLTFHDLVVQLKHESADSRTVQARQERKRAEEKSTDEQTLEEGKVVSIRSRLPRTQSDRALISEVYRVTGYKPRVVELHKQYLRATHDYKDAVKQYYALLDESADSDSLNSAQRRIETIRSRMYKISDKKMEKIPAQFQLATLEDPFTGGTYYLETWVVEHTSPRPTQEELKSPKLLYERYYRGSSSLSFLDQLKPWIIGE